MYDHIACIASIIDKLIHGERGLLIFPQNRQVDTWGEGAFNFSAENIAQELATKNVCIWYMLEKSPVDFFLMFVLG